MPVQLGIRQPPMAIDITDSDAITQAAAALAAGGLILYPTGCIYALFARADSQQAVERLRRVKNRPLQQGVSLVVPPEVLPQYADVGRWLVNELRHIYQWPVGLLFPALPSVPSTVVIDGKVLNLWYDAYPPLRRLWETAGRIPIAGTSANLRGRPGHYTFNGSWKALNRYVDVGVQAEEPMAYQNSTTLIDMEASPPEVFRLGAVSVEEVQRFILPEAVASQQMRIARSAP